MRVGPADVVDARDLLLDRLAAQIVGAHGVDHAERPAFLAGAVVRHDDDQGIVELARRFEESDQPRDVLVGMIEHGGVGRLQARVEPLLAVRRLGPRLHRIVARRQARAFGNDAQLHLAGEPALALDVPAVGEHRIVLSGSGRAAPGAAHGRRRRPATSATASRHCRRHGRRGSGCPGRPGRRSGDSRWRRCPGGSTGVLSRTSSGAYWSVSASMKP